jgi:hypothetical protein
MAFKGSHDPGNINLGRLTTALPPAIILLI